MMSHDSSLQHNTTHHDTKKKTNDGSRDPTTFSPGDLVPTPGRQQTADGRLYIFFFPFEDDCRKSEIGEQTFKSWPWPWVGCRKCKGPGRASGFRAPKADRNAYIGRSGFGLGYRTRGPEEWTLMDQRYYYRTAADIR